MNNSLCIAGMAALLTAYAVAATSAVHQAGTVSENFECSGADLANQGARLALSLAGEAFHISGAPGADCGGRRTGESRDRQFERFDAKDCGAEFMHLSKALHSNGAGSIVLASARRRGGGYAYRRFNCAQ